MFIKGTIVRKFFLSKPKNFTYIYTVEKKNNERVIERFQDNKHRARIYSGLTVISGVMLPNFCNTDSVYTAVQLILILM